jgi:hypothetical protein
VQVACASVAAIAWDRVDVLIAPCSHGGFPARRAWAVALNVGNQQSNQPKAGEQAER